MNYVMSDVRLRIYCEKGNSGNSIEPEHSRSSPFNGRRAVSVTDVLFARHWNFMVTVALKLTALVTIGR